VKTQAAIPYPAEELNPKGLSVQSIPASNWDEFDVAGRSGHAAAMWPVANGSSYMLVFGGNTYQESGDAQYSNDLMALDVHESIWIELSSADTSATDKPSARQHASMVLLSDHHVAVFGGTDDFNSFLNDLWVFDLERKAWWGPMMIQVRWCHALTLAAHTPHFLDQRL
jgi:N-acetylneuraminic acid mutarotase